MVNTFPELKGSKMILCIDIGNTTSVFGVFRDDKLLSSFLLESKLTQTADEYGVLLLDILKYHNLKSKDIEGVIITSVVPSLDSTFEKMINKYLNKKPIFIGPGVKTGIRVSVENPKQVGADIVVGAVAAKAKYGAPVIIIDMGTAITLFYVDNKSELVGGVIAPGIKTSYRSLVQSTARLEEVRLDEPPSVIGRDTVSCIQSAMIYGTTSMIDGIIRKMKKEALEQFKENGARIKVVLTGGESKVIKDFLEEEVYYDEDLVLEGLYLIYKKNK